MTIACPEPLRELLLSLWSGRGGDGERGRKGVNQEWW